VVYFGLNKSVGNISYYDSTGQSEYSFQKPYSDKTAEIIDHEVREIVESAYERAKKIILENKDKVEQLSNLLLEREVIFREDLEHIFGKRPFESEEEHRLQGTQPEKVNELPGHQVTELPGNQETSEPTPPPHRLTTSPNDEPAGS